jgi:hypothetical protein
MSQRSTRLECKKTTSVKRVRGVWCENKNALKSSGDERVGVMNEAPLLDGGACMDVMVIQKKGEYTGGAVRKGDVRSLVSCAWDP